MWIARISRNRGDSVVKEKLCTNNILELLGMLARILDEGQGILEIHIYKGGENGK